LICQVVYAQEEGMAYTILKSLKLNFDNIKEELTAVLPTPGSPIRHGLFFILLHNISNTLWFSISLPITGS
ncbi:Negative regulator of genetic competence ClpC/mecB, partial [human gut metagenome]